MKSFVSSVLISFGLGVLLFFIFFSTNKILVNNISAQTRPVSNAYPTITPCPNGIKPILAVNAPANYDPCNPPKPKPLSPAEIARREKQNKDWEARKKKLFLAQYPLKNEISIDVDGEGKQDKIIYQITPWKKDFEGLLKITSGKGKILWKHEFVMDKGDLAEFLALLEYDSITSWVKSVFNDKADYSFEVLKVKIKAEDIDDSQIEYIAKINKMHPEKLKLEILQQKINYVFTYRAEWREDFMEIVYIRSLKKFVCFSRGY